VVLQFKITLLFLGIVLYTHLDVGCSAFEQTALNENRKNIKKKKKLFRSFARIQTIRNQTQHLGISFLLFFNYLFIHSVSVYYAVLFDKIFTEVIRTSQRLKIQK
jgi:hypothetical protein